MLQHCRAGCLGQTHCVWFPEEYRLVVYLIAQKLLVLLHCWPPCRLGLHPCFCRLMRVRRDCAIGEHPGPKSLPCLDVKGDPRGWPEEFYELSHRMLRAGTQRETPCDCYRTQAL